MVETEVLREFGQRMDRAIDKHEFIDYAKDASLALDLGAGTGNMARELSSKWGVHVDAVDRQFKEDMTNNLGSDVSYYSMDIIEYLKCYDGPKYDCVILSAILHEMSDRTISDMVRLLPRVISDKCRIMIRECFYDGYSGPISEEFIYQLRDMVCSVVPEEKRKEYINATKVSTESPCGDDFGQHSVDWVNLAFTYSYGEQNWSREIHEYRFSRTVVWCMDFLKLLRPDCDNISIKTYRRKDQSYKDHFAKAGFPDWFFDALKYTGMTVIADYKN